MELVQTRMVTSNVAGLAGFYAALVGADVVVNDYYVEVPTGAQRVALSRMRFSELDGRCGPPAGVRVGEVILDFQTGDLNATHRRLAALGVDWVMAPTLQPWGRRSMLLRDPEGHLVNVFADTEVDTEIDKKPDKATDKATDKRTVKKTDKEGA
jgi:uncharacterized glyoxalase superfamily protein PhnB